MRTAHSFFLMLSGLLLSGALAATWVVDPGGGGDAVTIQGAVDLAAAGDEIVVKAGVYEEQVNLSHGLRIVGESGAAATTITAGEVRSYAIRGPSATDVEIEGLTLTGGIATYGYCHTIAMVHVAGNLRMIDCVVENNVTIRAAVNAFFVETHRTQFRNNTATSGAGCGATDAGHEAGCIAAEYVIARDCVFASNVSPDNPVADFQWAEFIGCTFRDHRSYWYDPGLFMTAYAGPGTLSLEGNLFLDNDAALVGYGEFVQVTATGNTFARNDGLFPSVHPLLDGSLFTNNVFSGADVGFGVPEGAIVAAFCNDSWGNGTNWGPGVDPLANFSLEPKFCAPGSDNFTVASNSPLLASNNPCGSQIGAFGQGCGPISVEPTSWGKVKSLYRGN